MKYLITLILLFFIPKVSAQDKTEPEFPGGFPAFYKFVGENFTFSNEAINAKIKTNVIVSFTVKTDSTLSNLQVLRHPGYGTGEEALRVLMLSPKWAPGNINGIPTAMLVTLPIAISTLTENPNFTSPNKIYALNEVDTKPKFQGGIEALHKFFHKKYHVPKLEKGTLGMVQVIFVVERDGTLSDYKIMTDVGFGTGNEAIRVLKLTSGKWIPALVDNTLVRSIFIYTMTVGQKTLEDHTVDTRPDSYDVSGRNRNR